MIRIVNIAIVICAGAFFLSCNESLPLRSDPILPISGSIEAYIIQQYEFEGPLKSSEFIFYPKVKNLYDETLQGFGDFKGVLEVVWERDTSFRKTIYLDESILVENRKYKFDPVTNVLTMDQYDEIGFYFQWDYVTDDGRRVDSSFIFAVDPDCYNFVRLRRGQVFALRYWNPRVFATERFMISGYIKPFKDLAAVRIPASTVEIFFDRFDNKQCRTLNEFR